MFLLVRILISAIVLLFVLYVLRENKCYIKIVISSLMVLMFFVILVFVPFENCFLSFDSAALSYKYYNPTNNVNLIVSGYESDLVVASSKQNVYNYMVIPKNKYGYMITTNIKTETIEKIRDRDNGVYIDVYHHKNIDDYYFSVYNIYGDYLNVSDSQSSEFVVFKEPDESYGTGIVYYYTSINNIENDYYLIINGEIVNLSFLVDN